MKKENINKKLNLKKTTIVNLNDYELNNIKGGSSWACIAAGLANVATIIIETQDQGGGEGEGEGV